MRREEKRKKKRAETIREEKREEKSASVKCLLHYSEIIKSLKVGSICCDKTSSACVCVRVCVSHTVLELVLRP